MFVHARRMPCACSHGIPMPRSRGLSQQAVVHHSPPCLIYSAQVLAEQAFVKGSHACNKRDMRASSVNGFVVRSHIYIIYSCDFCFFLKRRRRALWKCMQRLDANVISKGSNACSVNEVRELKSSTPVDIDEHAMNSRLQSCGGEAWNILKDP